VITFLKLSLNRIQCAAFVVVFFRDDFFFFFFFQPKGLQYEDLLAETPAVNEALRRLPHAMLVARDQRIKRAFDLSHKKYYLPVSQHSDPQRQTHVIRKLVKEVKQEFDERAAFRK
jgi:ubiquinol-cytochrome c reductase subunit 7